MIQEKWFGYPIWYNELNYEHHGELLEYCLHRKTYDEGMIKSNAGGWQSSDLYSNTDEILNRFCLFVQTHLDTLSKGVVTVGLQKKEKRVVIQNLWININRFNDSNKVHQHPFSYFSGVFYLKAESNQGKLCFENPLGRMNNYMYNGANFIDNLVSYEPKTGKLIIFPSFLAHYVEPNMTNNDRISISFNTFLE